MGTQNRAEQMSLRATESDQAQVSVDSIAAMHNLIFGMDNGSANLVSRIGGIFGRASDKGVGSPFPSSSRN